MILLEFFRADYWVILTVLQNFNCTINGKHWWGQWMGKLAETILNILWYLNNAHMDFIYDDFQ